MLLFTASLVIAVPASAAPFEGVTFTPLFSDAADLAGFLDIREVAVGEPGDETLILRFSTGTFSTAPPSAAPASIHLFMTTPGGAFRAGLTSTGAPTTHSSSAGGSVSACVVDGNVAYCTVTYESMKAAVGDELKGTSAISYLGAAQDYAPGGLYVPDGVLGPKGSNYMLTGCTAAVCPGPGTAEPSITYAELDTSSLKQGVSEPTTGTFVYNFTNELSTAVLNYEVNGTGNVTMQVRDGNGTSVFNQTFSGVSAGNQTVTAIAGNWTYTVIMDGFNGTLGLSLTPPAGETTAMGQSSTQTSSSGTGTGAPSEGGSSEGESDGQSSSSSGKDTVTVPGFEFLMLVLVLAFLSRRR